MIDLTPIVSTIITIIFALISSFLIPLIKKKLSVEKRKELCQLALIGAKAAEQMCKAGLIKPEERKEYVEGYLYERGLKLDIDEVETIIESCVYSLPKITTEFDESLTESQD